jgi:hypothetical protein
VNRTQIIDVACRASKWSALAAVVALLAATPMRAQEKPAEDPNAQTMLRFTAARWSQIRPNRDFEGGCVVGFLSFQFSPTGYFSFNNHIRGAWQVDEIGNLKLKTREGVRFTLIVMGDQLRPSAELPFIHRTDLFQRCPE